MDPKRPLSEISHLFLSEIRSRQPGGPRPTRVPPGKKVDASVDMTPEEFAAALEAPCAPEPEVQPATASPREPQSTTPGAKPCLSVVIAGHLLEQSCTAIRQYARQLADDAGQVALIEADGSEFALSCFEAGEESGTKPLILGAGDTRQVSEIINELAYDVDRWLVCLSNIRAPEARELLQAAPHWVMLTTADHEGVVATYRALKGLSELGQRRVSLVVLDARDDAHADAVFRKLDAVSRQFLHCGLEAGSSLRAVENVTEHALIELRVEPSADGTEAPHWNVIRELFTSAVGPGNEKPVEPKNPPQAATQPARMESNRIEQNRVDVPVIDQSRIEQPKIEQVKNEQPRIEQPRTAQASPMKLNFNETVAAVDNALPQVIDLPADAGDRAILDAVVRQGGADGRWVLCPIHPPMCPEALLAVGRDQRLMLLTVAGRGMERLASVASALRWMSENSELIRMALPQLSIDAEAVPAVTLLVDHNDLSAEVLQPMMQSGTVNIQAYRKVKWGVKTGLLLEAA
jgi:hypothetical protein